MRERDQREQKRSDPESLFGEFGFACLTEIQQKASPIVLQKRDCLIIAPTGSGKTECSTIPIFSLLKRTRMPGRIGMLYITPLRALNRDVFRRIIRYAHGNDLSIRIRHGDTSQTERKKIAQDPPDVLITTPETLVILLTQPKMLKILSELEWVVVDEVHELLASERGAQLSLSMERLEINSRRPITRIGLSATVGKPAYAGKFLAGTKRKCRIVQDTSIRKYDVEVRYINGTVTDVAKSIIEYVTKLGLDSPVLLFTNTRGEAEFLASILKEKSPIRIDLHHGSLSKSVREETEEGLRRGGQHIVVCTSSLELGLDIGSVEVVIHYGSPRQVSKFIQRIGRSRHNHESSAQGLIITNNPDDEFEARAILERIGEGSIEEQKIHDVSLDVLAHHLVGLTMQVGTVSVARAHEIVTRAYPFRDLTMEQLGGTLELLDSNYLLRLDGDGASFGRKGGSFRYYFENLSTIPDILKFRVFDSVGKRVIGTLDQRFVGDHGDQGNVFVLRGSHWRILSVDEKSFVVNVEPFRGGGITVPYWEGETIPIDYATARRVGSFRSRARLGSFKPANSVMQDLDFDVTDMCSIIVESNKMQGEIVMHSCLGTRINSTLATLLSSILSSILGAAVDSRSDGYRVALSSRSRITEERFLGVLKDDYDVYSVVRASLAGTHNVNWRTWCVAKKFGMVGREATYDRRSARFLYERYSRTVLVDEALRELFHDKYDIQGTGLVLGDIRDGTLQVAWREVDKFSRMAEPILDHTARYYSAPASLDRGIMDMVKSRLGKTKHRLLCARCGKWEKAVETDSVAGALSCPYCRGRQITATFYSDYDLRDIIQKRHAGKRLSADEQHKFRRAWKVSSLIENFGKDAITVMSGYGIGADTAARILRNMVDRENLFKQIYEAERQYVMTRGFWD